MYRFDDKVFGRGSISLDGARPVVPLETRTRPEAMASASFLASLLVCTAFLAWTWLSWRRLGSLIVDGGQILPETLAALGD